ncbi:DUF1524 domain-containing protein [Cryobacterium sp. CG_9.6]|uniref:GmrSD restriction endonuclease domain-containing protein n=1 Tax=Cryobacterium sp. CG_9.6 TaxID=2760710 RepID=UPI002475D998|nr:DUF1524 domain-containing protein [Cryobacterium sp. CG_9.6]MDH6236431.1 hypothetical protein [Cryobacterium sp. CG_9.6]
MVWFRPTRSTWVIGAIVAVIALVFAVAGGFSPAAPEAPAAATATPEPGFSEGSPGGPATSTATDTTALALLSTIPVKGKAARTGYDRTGMFGSAWLDVDRNGCDTRNDILARDLTSTTRSGTCRVMTGTLVSPFTAASIDFVRGEETSAHVQIDHVVALSNAWQTGAQQLTQAQRMSLANDPINLLAVDGRSNAQKGDGDTATWLPSNKAFRCGYVARQVSVKATYGLWVTRAEHTAMTGILSGCPGEPAVTSSFAPDPVAVSVEVSYANCDAVRAAGAAPLYAGDPGYSSALDRDNDGIGCDT